jgi:RND family efflux transporter MFP subunit
MTIPHKYYAITIVALAALLTSDCGKSTHAESGEPPAKADIPVVAVARAATQDLSRGLVLTAEFKPYQEVEVMAKVAGFIKQINVDVGDRVTQGQLLATLEIPEMSDDITRGQASIDRAESEVTRAGDELTRAQSSHDIAHLSAKRLSEVSMKRPGLVAQQEIDDAQSRDLVSEAQVSAAKSNRASVLQQVQVNRAELKRMRTMFEYCRVTAPFAGVITRRFADTGAMIQAGTASQTQAMPVVQLSENSRLRLILPVPESAVPTIHIGQQVEVRVPTMNRTFPGRVARFSEKVALATRTMETEVDVLNPTLVLMPGMYAEVNLTLANRKAALSIPLTAVDITGDMGQVLVVTPNNRIEMRKIALGLETSTDVEVLSGLNDGDMVVTGNRAGLLAGQEVRPKVVTMQSSSS